MTPGRTSLPWSFSEARTAFATGTVGIATIIWAWWESSGTAHLTEETAWGNVGVMGVLLVFVAALVWVVSGRRAVRTRRDFCVALLEQKLPDAQPVEREEPDGYLVVPGTSRYHRSNCLLVAGKIAFARTGLPPAELAACEMCRP